MSIFQATDVFPGVLQPDYESLNDGLKDGFGYESGSLSGILSEDLGTLGVPSGR
jgi:hypothetical protein